MTATEALPFGSHLAASPNAIVAGLRDEYDRRGEPVGVAFRDLLPELGTTERGTHLIHPYPAKLLRQIPFLFLQSSDVCPPGSRVLDPFCGSGTVLLESVLAGHDSHGADTNPLARLITRAKTEPVSPSAVTDLAETVVTRSRRRRLQPPTGAVDLAYWYTDRHLRELAALIGTIRDMDDSAESRFLLVAFSATARRLSLADLRIAVPVRLRAEKYVEGHRLRGMALRRLDWIAKASAFDEFERAVAQNALRMRDYLALSPEPRGVTVTTDAAALSPQTCDPCDLIVTSPPYVGAQKYLRSSSITLTWLGYTTNQTVRSLEQRSIGREHAPKAAYAADLPDSGDPEANVLLAEIRDLNPLRAYLAATYLSEMRVALAAAVSLLGEGGRFVLIAGSNQVAGRAFPTPDFLVRIVEDLGLRVQLELKDNIRSRSLMTSRNRTASVIQSERVVLFERDVR